MEFLSTFISIYWWRVLIAIVVAYLLGSLSFAVIISKMAANKQDVRTMGSGNAGFTNVLRTVGVVPAVFTLLFDLIKGILAMVITIILVKVIPMDREAIEALAPHTQEAYLMIAKYLAGAFCVFGHCFPIFFGFKGGKGVTTVAGMAIMLDPFPWMLVINLGVYLIVLLITKIVSISSISACVALPISNFFLVYFVYYKPWLASGDPVDAGFVVITTVIMFLIGAFVIFMHRSNIGRLIRGEEKKISAKKKEKAA